MVGNEKLKQLLDVHDLRRYLERLASPRGKLGLKNIQLRQSRTAFMKTIGPDGLNFMRRLEIRSNW